MTVVHVFIFTLFCDHVECDQLSDIGPCVCKHTMRFPVISRYIINCTMYSGSLILILYPSVWTHMIVRLIPVSNQFTKTWLTLRWFLLLDINVYMHMYLRYIYKKYLYVIWTFLVWFIFKARTVRVSTYKVCFLNDDTKTHFLSSITLYPLVKAEVHYVCLP